MSHFIRNSAALGFCAALSFVSSAPAQVIVGGAPNPNYGGLQLWLDAGSGVTAPGGLVSYWDDRSAANHDAQQGDGSLQPTYMASNPNFAGRPTLNFQTDLLTTVNLASTMGVTGTANRTILVAFRQPAAANADFLGYGTQSTGAIFDSAPYNNELIGHYYNAGYDTLGTPGPFYTAGDLAVMTNQYSYAGPGTGAVSIYGKTVTPNTLNAPVSGSDGKALELNTGDSTITIGRGTYHLGDFTGEIAEILVFNELLSATDRQSVEDYLFTKYTTPVPEPGSVGVLALAVAGALLKRRGRRAAA